MVLWPCLEKLVFELFCWILLAEQTHFLTEEASFYALCTSRFFTLSTCFCLYYSFLSYFSMHLNYAANPSWDICIKFNPITFRYSSPPVIVLRISWCFCFIITILILDMQLVLYLLYYLLVASAFLAWISENFPGAG